MQCNGDEESIKDCNQDTYSLEEGKNKLGKVNVAGVKCYVPDECVSPPNGGSDCNNGEVRLSDSSKGEGVLEYCYKGLWSPFCSLNETEATVACRQLGYYQSNCKKIDLIKCSCIHFKSVYIIVVSVFTDGRFSSKTSYTSYFEHVTCTEKEANNLKQCSITDGCQSTCQNPIGIKCYGMMMIIAFFKGHTIYMYHMMDLLLFNHRTTDM